MEAGRLGVLAIAAGAVAVLAAVGLSFGLPGPVAAPGAPFASGFRFSDMTPALGALFDPGAIQAFGLNASTLFLTGISVFHNVADTSLPMLVEMTGPWESPRSTNLTPVVEPYFHHGGVFGAVWNGSAWLFTGQAIWPTHRLGILVSYSAGVWSNLTPLLGADAPNEGIWIDGWNGSAWLLGGNSSSGAWLASVHGSVVTNLSSEIPSNGPNRWVQFVAWNGEEWIVGGRGVFGTLRGSAYTDHLPGSGFEEGGVFAADWNGSAWLVGGGIPARVAVLSGEVLHAGPTLPAEFRWWVGAIVWDGGGWYIGGKGATATSLFAPELFYWPANGVVPTDISSGLPPPFQGGQVQFGGPAPALGPRVVLLVGQGGYDPSADGRSHGALGTVSLG